MKIDRDIVDAFCKEAELQADLDSAETMKCKLEEKLQDPKETQTPFMSRINLLKQARLNSDYEKYMATVMRHRKNVFDLRTQLVEQHQKVDALFLQHLQETDAPELHEPLEISKFYDTSQKKITVFQACLRQFLLKLEDAQTAMNAGDQETQSPSTALIQECMQTAQLTGKELDEAIQSVNALSLQFEEKAYDTRASLAALPRFDDRGYEDLVVQIASSKPTLAQTELGKIIKDCEELEAKNVDAAYATIEDAQQTHQEQTETLVRELWQKAQHLHFSGEKKANIEYFI